MNFEKLFSGTCQKVRIHHLSRKYNKATGVMRRKTDIVRRLEPDSKFNWCRHCFSRACA